MVSIQNKRVYDNSENSEKPIEYLIFLDKVNP
jgi:hypothetical protein